MIGHFGLSDEHRQKLYDTVLEESHPDPEYMAMLALSGLIALFGLLQNSTAVIIGAMLISPLMNPILAAALALILGDGALGRKTAIVLGMSIGGVILVTWIVASLSPLKEVTPEILARSNPNLLDLFIALLSGLAGALALRGGGTSMTIVPGVAIAVAVIPPLAVVGFGLSTRQAATAGGAFLLFMTNLVAIIISAALVFRLFGFRAQEESEKGHLRLRYRLAISFLVLMLLSIPLFLTLRKGVRQVRLRKEVSAILNRAFATKGSSVSDLVLLRSDDQLHVHATLRTTRYYETTEVQAAQDSLRERFGPSARLDVDQILVAHGGLTPQQRARVESVITGGVVRPLPGSEEAAFDVRTNQGRMLSHLQREIDGLLAGTDIRRRGPLRVQLAMDQPLVFTLPLRAPEPMQAQTVGVLASQLASKISLPSELHGQVELSGPEHILSVEFPSFESRMTVKDRRAIAELARAIRGRRDLRLEIRLRSKSGSVADVEKSAVWRQIRAALLGAGLDSSRWTLHHEQAEPDRGVSSLEGAQIVAGAQGALSAAPVRGEFRLIQEF